MGGGSSKVVVERYAGLTDTHGDILGPRMESRFSTPKGIAHDNRGHLLIADTTNNKYVGVNYLITRVKVLFHQREHVQLVSGVGAPGYDTTVHNAMSEPNNLCVMENNDIIVTEFRSGKYGCSNGLL